jgi:hypothetical protein
MNAINNLKKGSHIVWSPINLKMKSLILSLLILAGIQMTLQAQDVQYAKPSWWFGGALGANFTMAQRSS